MRTLLDCAAETRANILLVLLPPANASIDDLVQHGFIATVREFHIAVDILFAEVTAEQVMNKTAIAALREEIVAYNENYQQIWFAGISLGAFNALHYAAAFANDVTGLMLLAPYPGTGDILREIKLAGSIDAWARAPECSRADERVWWHWLFNNSKSIANAKPIYIGLGASDRFIAGQHLLASLVPANFVDEIAGDHSWPIWCELWRRWLARGVLPKTIIENSTAKID